MYTGDYSAILANITDPFPNKALGDIPCLSERIATLICRNKRKIENMHDYASINGANEFVEGLEYHYGNFLAHIQSLGTAETLKNDRMLDHEIAAYLHRLGQFRYFAKHHKLLTYCLKIEELYLFRKKHIGHRSIDDPQNETKEEQAWQAGVLNRRAFVGTVPPNFDPAKDLIEASDFLTPKKYLHKDFSLSYQIINGDQFAIFTPQEHHPVILKEIEDTFSNLFSARTDFH